MLFSQQETLDLNKDKIVSLPTKEWASCPQPQCPAIVPRRTSHFALIGNYSLAGAAVSGRRVVILDSKGKIVVKGGDCSDLFGNLGSHVHGAGMGEQWRTVAARSQ
jgi:hypothetical protein